MRTSTLILFLFPAALLGAEGDSTRTSLLHDDFLATLSGTGRYLSSPFRRGGINWWSVGGVAAATGGVMLLDEKIRESIGVPGREDYNRDVWDIPTLYGDGIGVLTAGAGIYLAGLASGEKDVRTTGRMVVEGLLSSAIATYSLRFITGRSRPFTGDGPGRFGWFGTSHAHQSFPSGHTTAAFALSTVLAERIGTTWSRIGFYSVATWTAVSRVKNDRHWGSDVVLGAAIGFSAGLAAVRGEERGGGESHGLEILPTGGGVMLVYHLP